MSVIQAILLGILQGLTEFLPVSSSGHLIVFRSFLGIEGPMLSFDIILHVGTLFAVIAVFGKDIWSLIRHPFRREVAALIVATIPVVVVGVFFSDLITGVFSTTLSVGIALIFTGILMFVSDRFYGQRTMKNLSMGNALVVGIFQGLAVIPGLSRSGSTIFGALLCGMNRKQAAKFSFLLSVIAILGAAGKQSLDIIQETGGLVLEPIYFIGMVAAAVSGFFAIKFFLRLLEKSSMKFFAFYCWLFAAVTLIWTFAG